MVTKISNQMFKQNPFTVLTLVLYCFGVLFTFSQVNADLQPATNDGPSIQIPVPVRARIALIIDDVGLERQPAEELLKVPLPLTWSILPFAPYAREYALAAKERGFEILMHQPLETIAAKVNPGPGLIKRSWLEAEILRQLDLNLQQVPEAVGLNNHMGTTGPDDGLLTRTLMQELKRRNLFYIDSRTDHSIAESCARSFGVPFAKRDVFIDHYRELEPNKTAMRQLIKLALRDGQAIGIGHTRPGTAKLIIEMLPEFQSAGVIIVPISELVK